MKLLDKLFKKSQQPIKCECELQLWAVLRIALGLIFLWAFFDKLLGLGFTTCANSETGITAYFCDSAWINGGSPTTGFLKFAATGPFAPIFNAMAGNIIIDWLFMLGLLGIGTGLTLGIAMKLSGYSGALMMALMYLAVLPKENHPFIDDHIINLIALLGLVYAKAGRYWGLGQWWENRDLVKKNGWLA